MGRIKIELPEKNIYQTEIEVRISDVNYGNHLGNDALVSILHEARLRWLSSMDYSELDVEESGLIMNELVVNYQNESFYGDRLTITIFIGEISSSGFELYYELATERNGKKLAIAKAKTGMVFFNYTTRKISPTPEKFVQKIN